MTQQATDITIQVEDPRELFRAREFDPFTDDIETVSSIAQMAQLPHIARRLSGVTLRILMPHEVLVKYTEAAVRLALQRYCAHMIAEAKRRLAAQRWVGLRTFAVGLVLLALSLAASAGVQRLLIVPEDLRTLASEALIIAGWVVMWQPLDTLVSGWWPVWEEERTFKSISEMRVVVEASEPAAPLGS